MAVYDPVARLRARELEKRLSSSAASRGDPLPTRKGNIEEDDAVELAAVRAELKKADENVKGVRGEGFHCTLVFLTEAQRDAFLAAVGWTRVEGGRYIDGLSVAESLGVKLPPARPTAIRPGQTDRKSVAVGIIPDYPE